MRQWLDSVRPSPKLIAVVKANAYGHDAVQAARTMADAGVDFFAVTTATEAVELRDAGIDGSLLVFAPPNADEAAALIERGISVTVADRTGFETILNVASKLERSASIHLKIDSGMGRLGVMPAEAVAMAEAIQRGMHTDLEGVYTHFGRALERGFAPTDRQARVFHSAIADIAAAGIEPGLRHCANSAATLRDSSTWLDAVRVGTLLYGQYPTPFAPRALDLGETWQLKSRVVSVRDLPVGFAVGYGAEFVTRRPSRLAVLPIGYADGVAMVPTSTVSGWRGVKSLLRPIRPSVTIRGARAPIVGRIGMQMCSVDVTDIEGVAVGDVAVVPARRLAVSARLPRVYEV